MNPIEIALTLCQKLCSTLGCTVYCRPSGRSFLITVAWEGPNPVNVKPGIAHVFRYPGDTPEALVDALKNISRGFEGFPREVRHRPTAPTCCPWLSAHEVARMHVSQGSTR